MTQHASVVDDHVQIPERFQRQIDKFPPGRPYRHITGIGDRLPTLTADLVDHLCGHGGIVAVSVGIAPRVVDNQTGPGAPEHKGVLPANTAAGARDDGHPALKLFDRNTSFFGNRLMISRNFAYTTRNSPSGMRS